jgi:adenylate cyclase
MPDDRVRQPKETVADLRRQLAQAKTERDEALDQRQALAEVLGVINTSPGDLTPVFDAILEKATRLCEASFGHMRTYDGDLFDLVAIRGEPSLVEFYQGQPPIRPMPGSGLSRHLSGEDLVHIADITDDEVFRSGNPIRRAYVELGGGRSLVSVALRRDDTLFGAIQVYRKEVRPFTDKEITLLQNFAAQAVIAMENARLLGEQRGFTAIAERAEPEEVMALLKEYHAALGPIVAAFEGTLDHYSGDGIMVFFNDPVPTPEPAKRAVEMALAMRAEAQGLLSAWRRHGHDLGFGVGISQGYATLGQIGFAERMDYTAIGTVTNLAARLCAEAKGGQILISARIATAVEAAARLDEIGDLALKGLSQAVAVYNVVEATVPAAD